VRTTEQTLPLPHAQPSNEDDDVLLRRWTPLLLRATLIVATLLMLTGVVMAHAKTAVTSTATLSLTAALHQNPAALAMLGLMTLTLVPLIRVAFCLMLFLRRRNLIYVAMTAYVLAVLTAGIALGRMG